MYILLIRISVGISYIVKNAFCQSISSAKGAYTRYHLSFSLDGFCTAAKT